MNNEIEAIIEIETSDNQLIADLFEISTTNEESGQRPIPGGAAIILKKPVRRRSLHIPPETITLVLSLGSSIATNVVSTWLYEKLKGRATTLQIDRRKIQIEKEEIKKIIEETIQKYE